MTVYSPFFQISLGFQGAILSHGIEGHWIPQLMAPGMPASDDQSYYMREVQAYRVELSAPNRARFGLSPAEIKEEQGKLDGYYNLLTKGNKGMVDQNVYKQL